MRKTNKKPNKIRIGITLGVTAGVIDLVPMVLQKLSWDANLSAFSMWIIAGFLISTSTLEMNHILKGILISFLTLIPSAILIGWSQPISLIPIFLMTIVLGSLLGYLFNKFGCQRI